MIKLIYSYYKPYRGVLALVLFLSLLTAALDLVFPVLVRDVYKRQTLDLKPEQGTHYEMGYKLNRGNVAWRLSVFNYKIKDSIDANVIYDCLLYTSAAQKLVEC